MNILQCPDCKNKVTVKNKHIIGATCFNCDGYMTLLKASKAPVAEVPCSAGLDLLLEDIKSQYKWFDKRVDNTKKAGIELNEYDCGSRDAYGYMIESIKIAKKV